jgi:DNA helicase II / ATP-dependent DNA helicase PcrA
MWYIFSMNASMVLCVTNPYSMAVLPLNPKQQEAVEHVSGPLLIIAGAGTGKTKTLTHRIAHLIETGVPARSILAITFTNKAAKEMKERALHLIRENKQRNFPVFDEFSPENTLGNSPQYSSANIPFISTFHSLGVYLLREFHAEAGLPRHFSIYDRDDSMRVVKTVLAEMHMDPKEHDPKSLLSIISSTKGDGKNAESLSRQTGNPFRLLAGQVMERYEEKLREEKALDFDDLLARTVRLLKDNADVRARLLARWQYVHIDEYQDTNTIQFEIAEMLTGPEMNICAVGDHDQLIYSWRGAKMEHLLQFEKEFPGTRVVLLEENYRSTQTILAAANAVIDKNKKRAKKNLYTKAENGEQVALNIYLSGDYEANGIAEKARILISSGISPAKIAVLYRVNFLSRGLEDACLRAGIPHQVLGTRFFDRLEVKDILSYIRAALNGTPGDIARAASTPPKGIGKSTLAKMLLNEDATLTPALQAKVGGFRNLLNRIKRAAETLPVSEVILFTLVESGYEKMLKDGGRDETERIENLKELVSLATRYDAHPRGLGENGELLPNSGINALLDDAALATDQDSLEKKQDSVKLMTIHAAKGLEFDYVFIPGLEQGLFPHDGFGEADRDEEEERRLMYVALTRARKKLFLSYAMTRVIFGNSSVTTSSEFLYDIPENLLEKQENTTDSGGSSYSGAYSGSSSSYTPRPGKMDLIDF